MFLPQKCNFLSDYAVKGFGHALSCGFPIHPPALLADGPGIPYGRAGRLLRQEHTSGFQLADCIPPRTLSPPLVIRHWQKTAGWDRKGCGRGRCRRRIAAGGWGGGTLPAGEADSTAFVLTSEGVTGVDLKKRYGEARGNDSLNQPGGPDWAATVCFHTQMKRLPKRQSRHCPHWGPQMQGLRAIITCLPWWSS